MLFISITNFRANIIINISTKIKSAHADTTTFKDLKQGDVFYFLKDCNDVVNQKIYMRCGHTSSDLSAVNLDTGTCYGFDKDELVEILDAAITVKPRDKK